MQVAYFTDTAPTFDQGRVESWTIGGMNATGIPAGGTLSFSYMSLNPGADPSDYAVWRRQATVTDRAGNQTVYVNNHPGNRVSQTDFTNRGVRPGEVDYVTERDFNADGEIVEMRFAEGNEVRFIFDTPGLDRYREGNLLEARYVADTLTSGGRGDGHGGETQDLVWTYTYEPIFNRRVTIVEPRGNDPTYVPQNGGSASPARYTTTRFYDYEEGDPATNGIDLLALAFEIDTSTARSNLGDLNNDTGTGQAGGNLVRIEAPTVTLDASSNQMAIQGDTTQEIVALFEWNVLGQLVATVDAEKNRKQSLYFPEADPDGDGSPTLMPPDGRPLDTVTGGYLRTTQIDTVSDPDRNNKTDPPPVHIQLDYQYDAMGNLTGWVDGRGVQTRGVFTELNQVVEVRRAAATADASGPDGDPPTGRGETGLTALGFKVRFEYDANDNLVAQRVEDRDQDRGVGSFVDTTWAYDILDNPVSLQRELNPTANLETQFRYDANENRTELVEPVGNAHLWIYDERDLLFTATRGATGPRGGVPSTWTWTFDGNRNPIRLDDARGNSVDYEYDGHDRLVREIDQVGNTTEQFHDPLSLVVRVLDRGPVGGPTPTDRLGTTNVDLSETGYRYDELGRLIGIDRELFVPSGAAPGRPPTLIEGPLVLGDGAINRVLEYDRLSRMTFDLRDTAATRRYDYDGAGRVISRTDPDGSTAQKFYDASHNVVETAATELSSTSAVPAESFLTTRFHDALGRPTTVVDNLGQTTRYVYSSLDDLLMTSDPNGPVNGTVSRRFPPHASVVVNGHGNVTQYGYDALGRILNVERVLTANGLGDGTTSPTPDSTNPSNPDGLLRTEYQWDDNSLLFARLDDNLNTSSYEYDNQNRRTVFTADDDTETAYAYDAHGNLTSRTDPNGSAATTTFDAADRATMVSVVPASGVDGTTLQTFEYDGLDRMTRSTDNNSPTDVTDDAEVRIIYDSLSRVVEEVQTYGRGTSADRLVDLEWTADALVTALTYPSGRRIEYDYDASDRLTGVSDSARSEAATFDWYATHGRWHTIGFGNGLRVTTLDDAGNADIGYDGVRRITRLRLLDSTNTVVAGFEHGYDDAGNRLHELRLHHPDPAAGGVIGELYGFDSANRLVDFQEGPLHPVTLTLMGPVTDSQQWMLDGVGNWAQMTRGGTTYNFTPNNLNEYDEPQSGGTRVDDGVPDDAFDDIATSVPDGKNRAHDKNGNRTDDDMFSYTYDFRNRLVGVIRNADGAPIASYRYDAFDRRVHRDVTSTGFADEERRYFYADSFSFGVEREMKESGEKGGTEDMNIGIGELQECTLLEEFDVATGGTVREIVHGAGRPLWQVRGDGSSQYVHRDVRGNVIALTEGTGTSGASPGDVLERYTYDAYGKPMFQDAGNVNKVDPVGTFAAQSDFDSDLLYWGALYDPETGSRGTNPNNDLGGYNSGSSTYQRPDEGRYAQRSSEPDRARPTGSAGVFDGPYSFARHAPVNLTGGSMPQTREHILLGRQLGVPTATAGLLLPAIQGARAVRKRPGRTTYGDITLKRGILSTTGSSPTELGHAEDEPQPVCCKEKFKRSKPHINIGDMGGSSGSNPFDRHYVGTAGDDAGGIEHEDIGAPASGAVPGIEHDDIGAPTATRNCVCVDMPYPCGNSVCSKLVCGGECGGGGGGGGTPPGSVMYIDIPASGSPPGIEHEDIGAPRTEAPGIEHEDIGAPGPEATSCVCVTVWFPCGNGFCSETFCSGKCGGGGGGGGGGSWQTEMLSMDLSG
jgi:YD repeat-containing protein